VENKMSKADIQQLQAMVMQLSKQVQQQNQAKNTPLFRQMEKQAQQHLNGLKMELKPLIAERNELKSKNLHGTNLGRKYANQNHFIQLNGTICKVEVDHLGNASTISPVVNGMQFKDEAEAKQFSTLFPAEAKALKYNALDNQLSKNFFNDSVKMEGQNFELVTAYAMRPQGEFWHDNFNPENSMSNFYDTEADWKEGRSKVIKEIEYGLSNEGRIEISQKLHAVNEKITAIEKELGQTASFVETQQGASE
jgi:hypothetical protein